MLTPCRKVYCLITSMFALCDENILFFVSMSLITQKGVFAAEVNLVLYYKLAVGI